MVAPSGPRNSRVPTTVPTGSRATSTEESSRSNHTTHSGKIAASKAITSARSGSVITSIETPALAGRSPTPAGASYPRRSATRSITVWSNSHPRASKNPTAPGRSSGTPGQM
jgi:hypothetical protein